MGVSSGLPVRWFTFGRAATGAKLFLVAAAVLVMPHIAFGTEDEPDDGSPRRCSSVHWHAYSPNVWFGPLTLRGQSPFQLLRLGVAPWALDGLHRGEWKAQGLATWTNRWAVDPQYYKVDTEVLRFAFLLDYGISDNLHARIEVPLCWRGPGVMDRFIEGFHKTFGISNAHRQDFPRDDFDIYFVNDEHHIFRLDESGAGVGFEDVVLSLTYRIMAGKGLWPDLGVMVNMKLPTSDSTSLFGTDAIDVGASVSAAKAWHPIFVYCGLGFSQFGEDEIAGIPMRQYQGTFLLAVEWAFSERFSVLLQELSNTGPADQYFEFSASTHEATLGIKAVVWERLLLELGLIENLFFFKNSPDFGIHFGLSYRY